MCVSLYLMIIRECQQPRKNFVHYCGYFQKFKEAKSVTKW